MVAGQAWAKLSPAGGFLPLEDHGADVAAVLTRFLIEPHWRLPLERAAGRVLSEVDLQRLAVLTFLHDLGKANAGFWRRQFAGAPIVGHTEVCAALFRLDCPQTRQLAGLVNAWGAEQHLIATLAHHGRPLRTLSAADDSSGLSADVLTRIRLDQQYWRATGDYDPLAEVQHLLDVARSRYPNAYSTDSPRLPEAPRFVSIFAGLVTLADWLGSDEAHFPVGPPYGEAREAMRVANANRIISRRGLTTLPTPPLDFEKSFGFAPRGPQLADGLGRGVSVALVEAETGSGKTEAALWHWLKLRAAGHVDGLYFALPTRSAALQLHRRVQGVLDRTFGEGVVEAVLAVPGYVRSGDAEGQKLPDFKVLWPDDAEAGNDARWAAEAPRRYLAARVAVGTVDQVLMAGLKVRHAHQRAAALSRSLLVVDEVHASDAFMAGVLEAVIENHRAVGGHTLLLSATLGGEARARLMGTPLPSAQEAVAMPYPAFLAAGGDTDAVPESAAGKRVSWSAIPEIDDAEAIAGRAVTAARQGARVLVVRNSVEGAIDVMTRVEERAPDLCFSVGGFRTLHHGRFAPGDRRLLDAEVERQFGRTRPRGGCVLVGTQTLEQSLDIDADFLITDLAPIDVLLQRIGRLHRHQRDDRSAFAEARADILVPAERDLSRYLGRMPNRHGIGPLADGTGVYHELLPIEATLRLVEADPTIVVPDDNRRLVEGALHSEASERLERELGASWTNHGAQQSGIRYAERQQALHWRLDMGIAFDTLLFPDDESIRTRLGLEDRLVELPRGTEGPFGQEIERLTIPGWMAKGIPVEAEPIVTPTDGGFAFSLGKCTYVYSRLGLRRLAND